MRNLAERKCQQRDAEEDCREQNRHDAHGVCGVLRLRLLECGDAVGDRLCSRQGNGTVGKCLEQQEGQNQLHFAVRNDGDPLTPIDGGVAQCNADQPNSDDRQRAKHKEVRRNGEQLS